MQRKAHLGRGICTAVPLSPPPGVFQTHCATLRDPKHHHSPGNKGPGRANVAGATPAALRVCGEGEGPTTAPTRSRGRGRKALSDTVESSPSKASSANTVRC